MKVTQFLFFCLAVATLTTVRNTANSWYNTVNDAAHAKLSAVDASYKKGVAFLMDSFRKIFNGMKAEIDKRVCRKPLHSMSTFLEKMKSNVYKGRKIVDKTREEQAEAKKEEEDEGKTLL